MLLEDSSPSEEVNPVPIMWSRASPSQLCGWRPNNFVPVLIKTDDQQEGVPKFSSNAEVVTKRKRLQQFSYPKEKKNKQKSVEIKPPPPKKILVMKVDDVNRKQADISSPQLEKPKEY